ncbi:MAG: NAD(+) kinase [Gammaproteobacteria bacterium]|nr:NAD(+) kinase [Gammaproteobacteria bacterium]NNJ72225.1 NAD(+) kinase [Enterobacterales bacterium]
MKKTFKHIGIIGKPNNPEVAETANILYQHLITKVDTVLVEEAIAEQMRGNAEHVVSREVMAENSDLVIVVGGDGSMLNAARLLVNYDVPVLGINRGYLGFLTDIGPLDMLERVDEIIAGEYKEELRFLLLARVIRDGKLISESEALNDIVLYPGEISKMLEFEVYIDDMFAFSQRSDGIIVSTPTGSTAYALSGGGPIMHPSIDALVLVPMHPHTLSMRPIVVNIESNIDIVVAESNKHDPQVSYDGQLTFPLEHGDKITIRKKSRQLWLLHPKDYDYYHVLRTKLGWGTKL